MLYIPDDTVAQDLTVFLDRVKSGSSEPYAPTYTTEDGHEVTFVYDFFTTPDKATYILARVLNSPLWDADGYWLLDYDADDGEYALYDAGGGNEITEDVMAPYRRPDGVDPGVKRGGSGAEQEPTPPATPTEEKEDERTVLSDIRDGLTDEEVAAAWLKTDIVAAAEEVGVEVGRKGEKTIVAAIREKIVTE